MSRLSQTYEARLQRSLRVLARPERPEQADDLFAWAVGHLLLGPVPAQAREWLSAELGVPTLRADERVNAELLVALGAAAELFDLPGAALGRAALERVERARGVYGADDERLLAAELGAAALVAVGVGVRGGGQNDHISLFVREKRNVIVLTPNRDDPESPESLTPDRSQIRAAASLTIEP